MNREEFMRRLGQLLSDISEEERQDALDFYRSYFEDAGEGNEASILRELGSPEKVAEDIKRNLGAVEVVKTKEDTGAGSRKEQRSEEADGAEQFYGKNPYGSGSYGKTGNSSSGASYAGGSYGSMSGQEAMNQFRQEKKKNTVLWVILVILSSPIWLTVLIVARIPPILSARMCTRHCRMRSDRDGSVFICRVPNSRSRDRLYDLHECGSRSWRVRRRPACDRTWNPCSLACGMVLRLVRTVGGKGNCKRL